MRARSLNESSLIPSNEVPANEWSLDILAEQCAERRQRRVPTPKRRAHQSMIPARHSYRPSQDALETLKTRHIGHQNRREPSIQPCPNGRTWGLGTRGRLQPVPINPNKSGLYSLRKNSARSGVWEGQEFIQVAEKLWF